MKKLISILLVIGLFLGSLCGCRSKETTEPSADTAGYAMTSEHFKVSRAQMQYFFNEQYLSFLSAYSGNLDAVGLDTSKKLSEQACTLDSSASWYDYFLNLATNKMTQCLVFSEKALKDGTKLSAADKAEIEKQLKAVSATAKSENLSEQDYYEKYYGSSVKKSDVQKCMEMEHLVQKYFKSYTKKLDVSENALEKYYAGHTRLYNRVSYLYFNVPVDSTSTDGQQKAKASADAISAAKNEKQFKSLVTDYITNYYLEHSGNRYNAKSVSKQVKETIQKCTVIDAGYSAASAASRWAFDTQRAAGDTTVINETDGSYTVYYITSAPKREEYKTVNMRTVLFSPDDYSTDGEAKHAAELCLKDLRLASFSKDAFLEKAQEYSADTATKSTGGLYGNLKKDALSNADEVENWLFSKDRAPGDSALVHTEKYGWFVLYFESEGVPAWQVDVLRDYKNSRFNTYAEEEGDNYVIRMNNNILYQIKEAAASELNIGTEA